jgi:hypothetical protein
MVALYIFAIFIDVKLINMFINDYPGDWRNFVKRKDNIGKPLHEVKRKYLLEITQYEEMLSQSMLGWANASATSGAGDPVTTSTTTTTTTAATTTTSTTSTTTTAPTTTTTSTTTTTTTGA